MRGKATLGANAAIFNELGGAAVRACNDATARSTDQFAAGRPGTAQCTSKSLSGDSIADHSRLRAGTRRSLTVSRMSSSFRWVRSPQEKSHMTPC